MMNIRDEVEEGLVNLIEEKSKQCDNLKCQLYDLLESKAGPLKDRIIDVTIDDLSTGRLVGLCKNILESMEKLKLKSEPLRMDIEGSQIIKDRLEQSLDIINMILDLRSIDSELKSAITNEKYEQATELIIEFRSILAKGLDLSSERTSVDSIKVSEKQLIQIVGKKFREGVVRKNRQVVSDFAKLFFPLNLHKEGIYCYINFIRELLSNQCSSNFKLSHTQQTSAGLHSKLAGDVFRSVTELIQEHQKNVETQFGSETYLLFLRGLEEEVDIQIVRILDHFESQYAVSLSLPEESITQDQLKSVDLVLDELSSVSYCCQRFTEYIHGCGLEIMSSIDESTLSELSGSVMTNSANPPSYSNVHGLLTLSLMMVRIQEIMGTYVTAEHTFASKSINRAMKEAELSLVDVGPVTSTLPDDVFFMLKKCIIRAIASCDVFSVCAIINLLSSKLSEVKSYLQNCLKSSARLYTKWISRHFTFPSGRRELPNFSSALRLAAEQRDFDSGEPGSTTVIDTCHSILSWPSCINDLDACIKYIDTLMNSCEHEFSQRWDVPNEQDINSRRSKQPTSADRSHHYMFQQCLLGFESAKKEFQSTFEEFCRDFVEVMLQPVLNQGLHQFDGINYDIDQSSYEDYHVNDPFMAKWIIHTESLIVHFKSIFTSTPFLSIVECLIDRMTASFEASIFMKRFSLLGSVQIEKDIRNLASSVGVSADQPLRYKFSRLLEICEMLNVGSVEELRLIADPLALAKPLKLNWKEIRKLVKTRVDLPPDEIDALFNEPILAEY